MAFVHNLKRTLKFPSTLIPVGHKTKTFNCSGKWWIYIFWYVPLCWRNGSQHFEGKYGLHLQALSGPWRIQGTYSFASGTTHPPMQLRRPFFSSTTVKTSKPTAMILFHSADILHNDGDSPCSCKEDVTNINQIKAQNILGLI